MKRFATAGLLVSSLLFGTSNIRASDIIEVGSVIRDDSNAAATVSGLAASNGDKRVLVGLEFYGWQEDTRPNRMIRLFWVDLEAHVTHTDDGGADAPYLELNVTPVTFSSLESTDRPSFTESLWQFLPVQLIRDVPLGIDEGIRVMALGYRFSTFEPESTPGPNMSFAIQALGYAIERYAVSEGIADTAGYLDLFDAKARFGVQARITENTRVLIDPVTVNVAARAHLHGDGPESGLRFQGESRLALEIDHDSNSPRRPRTAIYVAVGVRTRSYDNAGEGTFLPRVSASHVEPEPGEDSRSAETAESYVAFGVKTTF